LELGTCTGLARFLIMTASALKTVRRRYAREIVRLAGVRDARIEEAFAEVAREAFLRGPPWTLIRAGAAWTSSNPADLYGDVLVVIDRLRGINNGEPALHAAWLAAVDPQPGETVVHVGAGTGYYTAMLSRLVGPAGQVHAFECEADLAAIAATNLASNANTHLHAESAYGRTLPEADIIYVNAGVPAPDIHWLSAMKPGARLVFPWQPHGGWGPAILVRRKPGGFSAHTLMSVGFIPCSGVMPKERHREVPSTEGIQSLGSIWLRSERQPDSTAIAVYEDVWFSSEPVG
jgi:protein-L-isoaspartate(D-aspartate) O-methyltransferase